uniref:Tyrosine aminotransferase n=1 Tax=Chromera velia CCMP2878 TaxID=1169474 RepID=A0A0G4GAC4_9ALVE|eukprot:Cvel_20894.t1-p1 / transcript=Cvel_20894.t1 / gene=Cvel_20894 / organism=Chromera_velia_CCMP2878 / gene_product=Tyrosine aminotransferase, putative / transcript_product=Tyrosine aminotransferase, putative / location=Cvel_scaffold1916:9417-10697(-) / protein_length=427 / sequence_SO=supercontig / SO=protein_coding / is_pseudo=false
MSPRLSLFRRCFHRAASLTESGEVGVSELVKRTRNPIRELVDRMGVKPNPKKEVIPLSIGDPTVFGNFTPPSHVFDELKRIYETGRYNGYAHSSGYQEVRSCIARRFSPPSPSPQLTANDVVLTSGCSQALDYCFSVLFEPGTDSVLLPRPGFPLYQTMCESKGIHFSHYNLLPEKEWEIDLEDLDRQLQSQPNVKAVLINNPSNPTGSVFSKEHLQDLLFLLEKRGKVLISDEIYADMGFPGVSFHSASSLSENVPILSVGGLAKQFMIPGWRVGWVIVHDRQNTMGGVRNGLGTVATINLGPCSLAQALVPSLLEKTPADYFEDVKIRLEEHARVVCGGIEKIEGLTAVRPRGAMYVMVRVDPSVLKFEDDEEFGRRLLEEESVFVLPGACFQYKGFFRIVTTPPIGMLEEAVNRIAAFCSRHRL